MSEITTVATLAFDNAVSELQDASDSLGQAVAAKLRVVFLDELHRQEVRMTDRKDIRLGKMWRVGNGSTARSIYTASDNVPPHRSFVGLMDSPELAVEAVELHNQSLANETYMEHNPGVEVQPPLRARLGDPRPVKDDPQA